MQGIYRTELCGFRFARSVKSFCAASQATESRRAVSLAHQSLGLRYSAAEMIP